MLVVALVSAPALWFLAVWLFRIGTIWALGGALLAAVVALIFTYGIFEAAQKLPRDSKGVATDQAKSR